MEKMEVYINGGRVKKTVKKKLIEKSIKARRGLWDYIRLILEDHCQEN